MISDVAISVRNLHKQYGRHQVLRGVSFDVPRGQTLALLGCNGAGKTTIIRTMMGLLEPDAGNIRVAGLNPQVEALALRRKVGFLAEDQQMFGWMTVDQLIRFVAGLYDTWDHGLAGHYLEQFQLPLRKKVKQLSKGQNIRLGLLLALAHRPEVLILDDPTLALDPIMRREFNRDLIAHLQGTGGTVLYSSHLLAEVEAVADQVAILHEGRIVRHASTDDIRDSVKRLVFPARHFEAVTHRLSVLDGQVHGSDASVVVDDVAAALSVLEEWEISPRVVDLALDDIFEAYVQGRRTYKEVQAVLV